MLTPLLSDLRPLKDEAKGLYDRVTAEGYKEGEGDVVTVSGLAEDLRDVLLEYWVGIQKAVTIFGSLKPLFLYRRHNNRRFTNKIVD